MEDLPKGQFRKDRAGEFQCACCGALYEVTLMPLPAPTKQEAVCEACRQIMNEWRGNVAPLYRLKAVGKRLRYSQ
jgi:hypothetical protein